MSPAPLPTTERIAHLFAQGYSLPMVVEAGQRGGWDRTAALRELTARGWRLDGSGRVPREQRPVVTPGRPLPRTGSGLAPSGFQPGTPLTTPSAPPPTPEDAVPYRGNAHYRRRAPQPAPPQPAPPQGAAQLSVEQLLAAGADHRLARVRQRAERARAALDGLRAALVELEAEDRARAAAAAERARLQAELEQLDAQRAELLSRLRGRTPAAAAPRESVSAPVRPPAPVPSAAGGRVGTKRRSTSTRPIDHGTWGGFLAHRYRGEDPDQVCPECAAAGVGGGRGRG